MRSTYSIMDEESQCCLVSRQRSPSLLYSRLFSHSNNLFRECCVLLLRHMTGQREHPKVQQQHTQPQNSHFTLTGNVFFSTLLMRATVAWYSSGATRDCSPEGNSPLKRLLRPNTVMFPAPRITIGSGTSVTCVSSIFSSSSVSSGYIASKSAIVLNTN